MNKNSPMRALLIIPAPAALAIPLCVKVCR